MKTLKYLVTGTGRCGTVYMARFLTSVGIPCGHESIFDWRGYRWAKMRLQGEKPLDCSHTSRVSQVNGKWKPEPNWVDVDEVVAESSYIAAPFLEDPILDTVKTIHVVRHPIKVINSFCNYIDYFQSDEPSNTYEQLIYRQLPILRKSMSPYDRAALFYILWNEMIESKADFFHKIEDSTQPLLDFLDKAGLHYDNKSINSRQKFGKRFVLDDLSKEIKERLLNKSNQYGYSDSSDVLLF